MFAIFVQPSKQEKQHLRPDYDRYNSIKRMIRKLEGHLRHQGPSAQKEDLHVFDTCKRPKSNTAQELRG